MKETADALGISEANVKVRLLRARLQLRTANAEVWRSGETLPASSTRRNREFVTELPIPAH